MFGKYALISTTPKYLTNRLLNHRKGENDRWPGPKPFDLSSDQVFKMYHHSSVPCTGIRLHHWSVLSKRTPGSSIKILNSFQRHVKKVSLIYQYFIHFKKLTWYNGDFSFNFFSLLKINEPMSFTAVYLYKITWRNCISVQTSAEWLKVFLELMFSIQSLRMQ